MAQEYKLILKYADEPGFTRDIGCYLRHGGYEALKKALAIHPKELADGFPTSAEDLFGYQGIIIGSVEAGYFTPAQQDLIRQFVDRRGGGVLWLGGRFSLADGIWGGSSLTDLLPVVLPNRKDTFHRAPATVELTPAPPAKNQLLPVRLYQ